MHIEMTDADMYDAAKGVLSTHQDEAIMKLKENNWLIKCVAPANDYLFACAVPKTAMESYDKGNIDKIGPRIEDFTNILSGSSESTVTMEMADHKLRLKKGNLVADLPMTDVDLIDGAQDSTPDLDFCATVKGDVTFIQDFVKKKAEGVVGSDSFLASIRDEAMYLYAEQDGKQVLEKKDYDDFERVEIDWDKGSYPSDKVPESGLNNPTEDKQVDTVISTGLVKGVHHPMDEGILMFDNHHPIKYLFENERGAKFSYFVFPRIPNNEKVTKVPQDLIEQK